MSIDNIPIGDPSESTLPILDPMSAMPGQSADQPAFAAPHTRPTDLVRVAVIGYGYWGPNVVRNFHGLDHCEVVSVCDKDKAVLTRASRQYPAIQMTTDFSEVLLSPQIDAVAIVTPVWTHFALAKAALENGKHVFLEKPLTSTTEQAEELIEL